jgi:hypothetical protein
MCIASAPTPLLHKPNGKRRRAGCCYPTRPRTYANFTQKQLPYSLLSDRDRVLIKALGAFVPPKSTKRSHFIFEKGSGKLIEKQLGVKGAERFAIHLVYVYLAVLTIIMQFGYCSRFHQKTPRVMQQTIRKAVFLLDRLF